MFLCFIASAVANILEPGSEGLSRVLPLVAWDDPDWPGVGYVAIFFSSSMFTWSTKPSSLWSFECSGFRLTKALCVYLTTQSS